MFVLSSCVFLIAQSFMSSLVFAFHSLILSDCINFPLKGRGVLQRRANFSKLYCNIVGREPRMKRSWHVGVSSFLPLAVRAESCCLLWLMAL